MIDKKTFRHHEYPRIMITIVEQHCKRMEFFQIDHGGVKVNQPWETCNQIDILLKNICHEANGLLKNTINFHGSEQFDLCAVKYLFSNSQKGKSFKM